MAGNPLSILQCFDLNMPCYKYNDKEHVQGKGGKSTMSTNPPTFAIRRIRDRWDERGHSYLNTTLPQCAAELKSRMQAKVEEHKMSPEEAGKRANAAQDALKSAMTALKTETIYRKEEPIIHKNESDVVRTAALYLLHPISQVLWAHVDYRNTFCSMGERSVDDVRADLTFWKATAPKQAAAPRPFAVVEFKRRTMIKLKEFEKTLQNPWPNGYDNSDNHKQKAKQMAEQIKKKHLNGLFKESSFWLIKQASSYAMKYRTRYVALYDYDNLICCYFSQLELDPSMSQAQGNNTTVGDFVELDIYSFSDGNGNNVSLNMRRALLGFLEDALVETPP